MEKNKKNKKNKKKNAIGEAEAKMRLASIIEQAAEFYLAYHDEATSERIKRAFSQAAIGEGEEKGNYRAVMCALAELCVTYCQMGVSLKNRNALREEDVVSLQDVSDCLHGLIDVLVACQDNEELRELLDDEYNPNEHRLDCN